MTNSATAVPVGMNGVLAIRRLLRDGATQVSEHTTNPRPVHAYRYGLTALKCELDFAE